MELKIENKLTNTRKQRKYKTTIKTRSKRNPNELWGYNIPQSIGDLKWNSFEIWDKFSLNSAIQRPTYFSKMSAGSDKVDG